MSERGQKSGSSRFHYFMHLPPELRRMIYIELLTLNGPARYRVRVRPNIEYPPHPTAILATCEQISLEARPIFFQRNLFITPTPRMNENLLFNNITFDITRLLCRLHCVIRNDTASCGMLKILAQCRKLSYLKISVKVKDMVELIYYDAWDCFSGFNKLTSNFLASNLLGQDEWESFRKLVMSECKVKSCHIHRRISKQEGPQQRWLEIDLKGVK